MKMKMSPLHELVVVKPLPEKEKSQGGIIMIKNEKEPLSEGEVKIVSKNVKDVSVGDKVLFNTHAGSEMELDGEKVNLMSLENILAII